MKRKIVAKLLAGCLSVAMISPLTVQAASVEQEADVQSVEQTIEEGMGEENVQTEEETVAEKEEASQPEEIIKEEETEETGIPEKEEVTEQQLLSGQSSQEKKQGWEQVENRWKYIREDGTNPQEEFEEIKGKTYYFDREGWMATNWQEIEEKWYYFGEDGAMLTGWQWINGKCYYMKDNGVMEADTWIGEYYVDKSGAWIPGKSKENHQSGWIQNGNRWWYRHSDGSYTKSDWEKINGKWYYFDASGWMITGWQKVNGTWYYMNGSGRMLTGWQLIGNSWYYLNGSGAMQTGWQKIGAVWYYMDGSGRMLTGWQWINGKCYYMNNSGAMAADTWIGNYYVDGSGAWIPNKTADGWVRSGNRWWYRHSDGSYTKSDWEKINGKWYYFDREGWMLTGWQKVSGTWYYMDGSGAMLTGWQKIGGTWYYLNGSGAMLTGWQKIDGKWYYLKDSGAMASNTWIGNYYVNGSGVWEEGKTLYGWQQEGARWYYVNTDGTRIKSSWKTIKGSEYYFDENGWMVTGWLKKGNNYYYLKENGTKASNYWVGTTGVGGYYINKYGIMVANSTYSVGDYIYSFNSSGLCTSKEERYVRAKDKNGRTYKVEKQYKTDPQVGVDVTEDEFLAAAVYTEAGNQGMPGMTGVALVMLNRMNTTRDGAASPYPSQANIMIYQAQQFEVARNGTLTKWLKNIKSSQLDNAKAAVKEARRIINEYNTNKTPRTVEGLQMPAGKKDFNYMGFMTPKAFNNANLDWEKTEAFTYLNTTFYTTWIKKK